MKIHHLYNLILTGFILLLFQSCKKNVLEYSLWRGDTRPFGLYVAYNNLAAMFPDAEMMIADKSPYIFEESNNQGSVSINNSFTSSVTGYFIIHNYIFTSEEEEKALVNYAAQGNFLFISSREIPKKLLDRYNLKIHRNYMRLPDSLTVSVQHPETNIAKSFAYPAFNYDAYFQPINDDSITVLGYDENGNPNFIQIHFPSNGAIFLHLAPSALTNYFLLYKENIEMYQYMMSYLPSNLEAVYWDDYFRYKRYSSSSGEGRNDNSFSALKLFREHEILKWAFWLTIFTLLSILLLETKRKQRIIPVIKPLQNTSLNFIKTIGNLYFQKKNNNDIGQKMTNHFTEYIRSNYHIPATELSEDVIIRLSEKSGYDKDKLKDIAYYSKMVAEYPLISDEIILEYYKLLEQFYKHK